MLLINGMIQKFFQSLFSCVIVTCTLVTCIASHKLYVLFSKSVFIVIIIRGLRYYMYCILTNQNMSDNSFLGKKFRIPPLATTLCITLSPYSPLLLLIWYICLTSHSLSTLPLSYRSIIKVFCLATSWLVGFS